MNLTRVFHSVLSLFSYYIQQNRAIPSVYSDFIYVYYLWVSLNAFFQVDDGIDEK